MKIEDFGFQPVMGQEYVVTFSKDEELLSTSVYNGSDLPPVAFPDNAKINLSITDKETGKHLMSSDFISYNGKLYKAVFDLPLKNTDSNKNANIYIKDLHYDLTTGSVLVQVQGFQGDSYQLNVSDTTVQHKVAAIPIVLEDDMYYSIPTELVQGNKFEVTLQDSHGKSIDLQEFTAPISTDWRYTDTVEDGTLELDQENQDDQLNNELVDQTGQQGEEVIGTQQPLLEEAAQYKTPIIIGGSALVVILVILLILRMMKKRAAKKAWNESEYDDESEEKREEELDEFEEVGVEEDEDKEENSEDSEKPKK